MNHLCSANAAENLTDDDDDDDDDDDVDVVVQVVHLGPVDLVVHLAGAVRDASGHERPDFFAKILSSRPSCHQQAAAEPGKEKLEAMYFCLLLKKQTSQSPKSKNFKLLQRRVDANLEKRLDASDRDDMWNGISQQLSMLHQR